MKYIRTISTFYFVDISRFPLHRSRSKLSLVQLERWLTTSLSCQVIWSLPPLQHHFKSALTSSQICLSKTNGNFTYLKFRCLRRFRQPRLAPSNSCRGCIRVHCWQNRDLTPLTSTTSARRCSEQVRSFLLGRFSETGFPQPETWHLEKRWELIIHTFEV